MIDHARVISRLVGGGAHIMPLQELDTIDRCMCDPRRHQARETSVDHGLCMFLGVSAQQ